MSLAGEKVRITSHESDVADCKYVGEVEANPPYHGPNDMAAQLKNAAARLGADVVVNRDRYGKIVPKAYDCGGRYN